MNFINLIKASVSILLISTIHCEAQTTNKGFHTIHNDAFWNTVDGKPIYSHGGGIFRFTDPSTGKEKYYWYGVRYKGSEEYRKDPSVTITDFYFEGVTCYTSDNLVDWTYAGDVLTKDEISRHEHITWIGRLGVAYIPEKKEYTLIVQCGREVLFATSQTPAGQYHWQHKRDMTSFIGTSNTGDQTIFYDDETKKSYLVYSYGRGRNKIYISEIGVRNDTIDLIDCTQVFQGESREGNCMFKYKGRYYMCASNIYGWDSSYAYYLVADSIHGPYLPVNDMKVMHGCEKDYAHISQTGFFYTIKGTKKETVIFCGDRWSCFAGNGIGYNQWVPLSFDKNAQPIFNSLSSWSINDKTGEWYVNKDNNYVLNGSFEADRRSIPNAIKPRQEYLLGWNTEIIKGRQISVEDSLSPKLNYFNTREDRHKVIGEKSLCISDREHFIRKVSQIIESSHNLPLPNGEYVLTAKVRRNGKFKKMIMYANSNGKKYQCKIKPSFVDWTNITIQKILINNGKVEIGFEADGYPNAECLIDDVELHCEE